MDKVHRSCENSCYELLRLLANVEHVEGEMGEDQELDPQYMLHCAFYLLRDLAHRIHDHRKKKSILGCVDRENVLFSKKDVANAKLTANININLVEIAPALLALPLFEVMETLTPKAERVEKVVDALPDGAPTSPVAVVGTNKKDKITPARRNDSQPLQCKLRSHLDWWIQHASLFVVRLIKRGVEAHLWVPDRRACGQHHTAEEIARAMQVLREYAALGACVRLSRGFGYCVRWLLLQQTTHGDAGYRFIMDMTWMYQFIRVPKFRLDGIGQVFPPLRRGM